MLWDFGIHPTIMNTSFQKLSFSSSGFPECGAYTKKAFTNLLPKTNFTITIRSLTTLFTHFSATNIPMSSISPYFPSKTVYILCLYHQRVYILYFSIFCLVHMLYLSMSRTSTNSPTLPVSHIPRINPKCPAFPQLSPSLCPNTVLCYVFLTSVSCRHVAAPTRTSCCNWMPTHLGLQCLPHHHPDFYAECPSCHNNPNLSWLGTCTEL